MKKKIMSILGILSLIVVLSMTAIAERDVVSKSKSWGESIQEYVVNPIGENTAVLKSLKKVEENNKVILPQIEIEQAKAFYVVAGYEEKEALDLAVSYVKDINTLYQEAIKNGYSVTEEEILKHLEELKEEFQIAENKEEIFGFINSFESEEEYWAFQFEMFKKDLPIQKYVAAKEKSFMNEKLPNHLKIKSYSQQEYAEKVLEIQEEWNIEFESMKKEAESCYSYIIE